MSTSLCSFIVYLDQETEQVPIFLKDIRSFFSKFPITYEILFVMSSKNSMTLDLSNDPQIHILQIPTMLSRGEGLRRGLDQAQGQFLFIADSRMVTPWGDLFKIFQHLATSPEVDLCWGERYSKKTGLLREAHSPRHRLEHFFNRIFKEKYPTLPADLLCESVGIKSSAWQKMAALLPVQKNWYLSPELHKISRQLNLQGLEVFIHDSGQSPKHYPLWKIRWELFLRCLK